MAEHEPFTSIDMHGTSHSFVLEATRSMTTCGHAAPRECATIEIEIAIAAEGLGHGYNASFHEVRPGVWRPWLVNNRSISEYVGKGITASLYRWVAATTGGVVQSCISEGKHPWDSRNGLETRVWRRLEANGAAVYDAAEDRFYHPRKPE